MMIADSGIESGSSPEINSNTDEAPMSRTTQYRKVMKPLLERKRRARINKCLDNLKDIMVNALQAEGESITKLEKADVLELTVKHLKKLKQQNALGLTPQATYAGRFRAGYSQCAQEVSKFMSQQKPAEVDTHTSARLLSHLSGCIHAIESMPPSVLSMAAQTAPAPMGSPPQAASAPGAPITTTPVSSPRLPAPTPPTGTSSAVPLPANPGFLAAHYSAMLQQASKHQLQMAALVASRGMAGPPATSPPVTSISGSPSTSLEEYQRALSKTSVLCGFDDKAWRPW